MTNTVVRVMLQQRRRPHGRTAELTKSSCSASRRTPSPQQPLTPQPQCERNGGGGSGVTHVLAVNGEERGKEGSARKKNRKHGQQTVQFLGEKKRI